MRPIGAFLLMATCCLAPQAAATYGQDVSALRAKLSETEQLAHEAFTANNLETSVAILRERREVARQLGDAPAEAWSVKQISFYSRLLGDFDLMLETAHEAIPLYRAAGPMHEYEGWQTLALAYEALNAARESGEAYDRADALQNGKQNGMMLDRAGQQYERAGEFATAIVRYEAAVDRDVRTNNLAGQMRSRARAAALQAQTGDRDSAIAHLAAINELTGTLAMPVGPMVLQLLGLAYAQLGDRDAALRYLDAALAATPRSSGATLDNLRDIGLAYVRVSAPDRAIPCFTEAILLARDIPLREARLRAFRARAERDAGMLEDARADLEWSLPVFESVRASVSRPQLRGEYFSTLQRHYELYIDVLMRMHALAPTAAHDRAALQGAERARGRLLSEALMSGGLRVRLNAPTELVQKEEGLRRRLTKLADKQHALAAGPPNVAARKALAADMRAAEQQFDEVRGSIERHHPSAAALISPAPADIAVIQRHLRDAETVLLEYALGESRSYLFLLTADALHTFDLGPRSAIEHAARRLHEATSRRPTTGGATSWRQVESAERALADFVIAPAVPLLQGKRIAIVAEGALQYVPFQALSALAGHEIVHLPSASVLVLQRETANNRPRASKHAAIFADPVFDASDPRLGTGLASRPSADRAGRTVPRLPFSRREAQAVAASFAGKRVLIATDFRASKQAAISGDLADYRIVHFATHGIVDTTTAIASGLVLSQFDERGRRRDGYLGLHDIYALRLSADLVVLSACETALGPDVRGEGLIGLTRGFMYAGARRVLATLWQVDDAATGDLMKYFYAALTAEGMTPAAALKRAQHRMRQDPRWQHPYYWAGFQLHGDWR